MGKEVKDVVRDNYPQIEHCMRQLYEELGEILAGGGTETVSALTREAIKSAVIGSYMDELKYFIYVESFNDAAQSVRTIEQLSNDIRRMF